MLKTPAWRSLVLLTLMACTPLFAFAFEDFKPIKPEELALKDNPKAPGAHAMILDMTDTREDTASYASHYYRVKIFTNEGKKYADIEIPYIKGQGNVVDIKARTVHPDGSIVPFNGQVYDKLIVKGKGFKYQAKTFTMPDVQPGSVIEYKYKYSWDESVALSTHWELQDELYIKHATYTIKPYTGGDLGFAYQSIGVNAKDIQKKGGNYVLELNEVPAFTAERYAPPKRELVPRFEFYYTRVNQESDPDKFWKKTGQELNHADEDFIGHRGFIQSAAQGMVAPGDSTEVKLRKIYAKVQEIKNLSFRREMTEQEEKRQKLKDINNIEDVLKRGYGRHNDLNDLYAGLVRAVGIDAAVVHVSRRDDMFFRKELMDSDFLRDDIVMVQDGTKQYILDPGTAMCPFGEFRWRNSGVVALKVSKDGGQFFNMPNLQSDGAVTNRLADLKFVDGMLKGTVEVRYSKQDALVWRISELTSDEAEFKTDLEDDLKKLLAEPSTVKLTNVENARDPEKPLVIHYDVETPFLGSQAGSRMLMAMEIFHPGNSNPFLHEERNYPLYFSYPYQEIDEIDIALPPGMAVENVPQPKKNQADFAYYDANWGVDSNKVQLIRRFAMLGVLMPKTYYPQMRTFWATMSSNDQESVVFHGQKTASK